MKVKSESEVAQLCLTLRDSMDCSPPGFSVHGISRQEYWNGVSLPSPASGMRPDQISAVSEKVVTVGGFLRSGFWDIRTEKTMSI